MYRSNFRVLYEPPRVDCQPLVQQCAQAVVARGHLYSPADVQRLPAEVETSVLWPLVCSSNASAAAAAGFSAAGKEWDHLDALGWFQRQPELDLRHFLSRFLGAGRPECQERGLAVVERLKVANLGPVRVILDSLNMPCTCLFKAWWCAIVPVDV
jgi:hypothetical protein